MPYDMGLGSNDHTNQAALQDWEVNWACWSFVSLGTLQIMTKKYFWHHEKQFYHCKDKKTKVNPIYCSLNNKSNDTDLVMQTNELFIEAFINKA